MNKRRNRYYAWLAFVHVPLTGMMPGANPTFIDVFPLSREQRTVYRYTEDYTSWSFQYSASVRDSGLVEYIVIDSMQVNDTTIGWSIKERWQFTRRVRTIFPATDTTFMVDDSTIFSLKEFTTEKHELRGTSHIWDFPAFGLTPVFRLSDSSQAAIMIQPINCMPFLSANYDSLWFNEDSGLAKRAHSMCVDFDDRGWAFWRDSQLLSRTVVSVEERDPLPMHSTLLPNYPNPFNPSTTIDYQIADRGHVTLKVFDVLGREVATLVDETQEPGGKSVGWNASDVTSGLYFYQLKAGSFVGTRKMLLVK
ncbi:MAG TPA: T9SS type A sorting domain-containing protein [Bacteroidota bacterium]